jgi:hypothetical protein
MRPLAHRSPLATVLCLALGALALFAPAAHAEYKQQLFKGPVMVIGDGLDWSTGKDVAGHPWKPGKKITTTLRIGNGIPGQAGYTASRIPRRPQFVAGKTQVLDFPGPEGGPDDVATSVRLPFPFPFGGLRERTASVSSNGRISFGSPAWDSWENASNDDRGAAAVGDFERGIMPYWGDLESEVRGMKMVTAADDHSVAFQWKAAQSGGGPQRSFQLILFRDGRFRFDYPGRNRPGGRRAMVGYSLGTGAAGFHAVATDTTAVPGSSLLFSPRSVKAAKALPAGRSVLDLPAGAVPNLPRECNFQRIDEELGPGEILPVPGPTICWIPALAPGAEVAREVTFKVPSAPRSGAKKEVSTPGALGYSAAYAAGPVMAADDDEVSLSASHHHEHYDGPNWISVLPIYSGRSENGQRLESGAPPAVGQWAEFGAAVTAHVGKVNNAVVTVKAPPNAVNFQISAYGTACSAPSSENVITCSWSNADEEYLRLTARMRPLESAVGSPLTVQFTVTSPGFEPNSAATSSPPVVASP